MKSIWLTTCSFTDEKNTDISYGKQTCKYIKEIDLKFTQMLLFAIWGDFMCRKNKRYER